MTLYNIAKDVTFTVDFVEFNHKKNQLVCSLQGEFLYLGRSYDPPLPYSMVDVPVMTRYVPDILYPVYVDLIKDKRKEK